MLAAFAANPQTPAPSAGGQTPASANGGQTPAASGGVESEWDLKKMLDALSAGARRLKPLIEQANPESWADTLSARSYTPQWKTAQNEIQYLTLSADKLVKEPESLALALEAYFRLQALDSSVSSLIEGVRKYRNPAVADLMQGSLVENLNNRERLKVYLTDLAQTKEQEFKIMDKEAQRCRGIMSKQPPPGGAKPRSK
jgi:hypothetical protein